MSMKFLPTARITVDLLAGTSINDAASDLCELANRLGLLVEADFNGIKLWARPDDDPAELVSAYHEQLRKDSTFKIASCARFKRG